MAWVQFAKHCWGLFHTSLHLPAPLDYQFKLNAAFGHWPLNV